MTDKQAAWFCILTGIIWMPALLLGMLAGCLWFGLRGGWGIQEEIEKAMDQRNAAFEREKIAEKERV